MNKERMLMILADMDSIDPSKLNMGAWICDTSYCIIGFHIHQHKDIELKYDGNVIFERYFNFEAIAKYLDIPHYDAINLFGLGNIDTNLSDLKKQLGDYIEQKKNVNGT